MSVANERRDPVDIWWIFGGYPDRQTDGRTDGSDRTEDIWRISVGYPPDIRSDIHQKDL